MRQEDCFLSPFMQRRREMAHQAPTKGFSRPSIETWAPCCLPLHHGPTLPPGRDGGHGPKGFVRRRRGPEQERYPHLQVPHHAFYSDGRIIPTDGCLLRGKGSPSGAPTHFLVLACTTSPCPTLSAHAEPISKGHCKMNSKTVCRRLYRLRC